jgi:hypothetical protein
MAAFDVDAARRLEEELRNRRQVLVEVTAQTSWKPETTAGSPKSGYVLASNTTYRATDDRHQYVSDINANQRWRIVDQVFPSLDAARRYLRI